MSKEVLKIIGDAMKTLGIPYAFGVYNKKPLPHLYNAKVGGASYFNGLPETNILNLCFSTPNLNLSKLK